MVLAVSIVRRRGVCAQGGRLWPCWDTQVGRGDSAAPEKVLAGIRHRQRDGEGASFGICWEDTDSWTGAGHCVTCAEAGGS